MPVRWRAALLVTGAAALCGACFSERTSGPLQPGVDAVCDLSIADLLQGGAYVPIRGFDFLIDTLRVRQGTRVTWVNCEAAGADPHTVTSEDGVWESPFIPVGATFSRTFDVSGSFPYYCIPHPFMRGVVIVE
jgi:plastocyanin